MTGPRVEEYVERALAEAIESREAGSNKPLGAWFALLGPPTAALIQVMASLPLAHVACNTGSKLLLHVLTLVLLGATIVAGLVGRSIWTSHGAVPPGDEGGPVPRRRMMALLGMIGAAVSILTIIGIWLPNAILPVCVRT